ncbi:Basic-leucine zipper domain [Arabidopsis thaliana x Arabidopsis arenosa]|uniref:Basic-leucine zipper domain n=1 Tax=Arabidopsis thaliana x Arabidopsis arenosa TaxID=1240361 RepID=A0A8T1Z0Y3_9BRAS|nr:Basic-leucine zipper domain [Arabidopsis thaliana x Arabidopsis arenosa]
MASSKGSQNLRNLGCTGKQALLPPKSPFTGGPTFCSDFPPSSVIGSKAVQKLGEGNVNHHRTSSESFLIEEQPSWLDDLLNEPETPVRKGGHRRSSSDSFAYVDVPVGFDVDYTLWDGGRYNNNSSFSAHARGPKESDYLRSQPVPFYPSAHLPKQKMRTWDSLSDSGARPNSSSGCLESSPITRSGSSGSLHDAEKAYCAADGKKDFINNFSKSSSEKRDNSLAKSATSEADTKRARQQFAQRSRVRKIQYIAELERNVQMLQVEGSEVSAELEFLNQQNLILSLENKSLKNRLESLAQEQLIKYLEHDVLEKEIVRLRALYQLQQQHEPQQQQQTKKQGSSSHQRSKSRDLESQFTNLSLRP